LSGNDVGKRVPLGKKAAERGGSKRKEVQGEKDVASKRDQTRNRDGASQVCGWTVRTWGQR